MMEAGDLWQTPSIKSLYHSSSRVGRFAFLIVKDFIMLAFITKLTAPMILFDPEPDRTRGYVDGKLVDVEHKPSMDTICRDLGHWTVVLIPLKGYGLERIYTLYFQLRNDLLIFTENTSRVNNNGFHYVG